MPGGISNPIVGYAAFCAVKLAGYSLAAKFLSRSYGRTDRNAFAVGGVRTLIGIAAGAAYFGLWNVIPNAADAGGLGYLAGLVPIRILEWWFLLWLFYDRPLQQKGKDWRNVLLAVLWSFFLDIPALLGLIFAGGFWIC